MRQFRKILVTTDLSRLSAASFDYAKTIAGICRSEIILLHVIDEEGAFSLRQVDVGSETVLKDAESHANSEMKKLVREYFQGVANVTVRIARGSPHTEILRTATSENADCIILATHGRTGLARAFIGSVAEKVVRHSTIPVLTVTPKAIQRATTDVEQNFTPEKRGG